MIFRPVSFEDFNQALKTVGNFIDISAIDADRHSNNALVCFLNYSESAGYAIGPDYSLKWLFSRVKGSGAAAVRHAINNGANHLDCYEGHLPNYYKRFGFIEYKREKNWTPGGPDVVFMHFDD